MKIVNKPILLVEDDLVDVITITRALKDIRITNRVLHRENGEEALKFLRDPNTQWPFLILLDLTHKDAGVKHTGVSLRSNRR